MDSFKLPDRPFPEAAEVVDELLGQTRDRLHSLDRRHLAPEKRQAIIDAGYTLTAVELADLYGISRATVHRIRARAGLDGSRHCHIRRQK